MDRYPQKRCVEPVTESLSEIAISQVSMEAEIPEVLYRGMKDFIGLNPCWDQYQLLSSAIAHFYTGSKNDSHSIKKCAVSISKKFPYFDQQNSQIYSTTI